MNTKAHLSSFLAVALGAVLACAAPSATAAVTTVYKCFDRSLGVVYTDQPCRGEQLDIEAGRVDQNAIAELQREREALSRAVAQRIADNRRAPVASSDYVAAMPPPAESDVYYDAGWGYYAPYANDRLRDRDHRNRGGAVERNRPRTTGSVPATPPSGITNRPLR